ncbi:MAG: hypothetical protein OEW11_03590 [Nitrospirota bacterium]|nr:hypothetical protein [Nitrospirota bacterium]
MPQEVGNQPDPVQPGQSRHHPIPDDPAPPDPVVRVAKIAVVLMTVLLVAGVATLIVTASRRQMAKVAPSSPSSAPSVRAGVDSVAGAVVTLRPGARAVDVSSAPSVVDVLVENPDGTRDVVQIERSSGRVRGVIQLRSATTTSGSSGEEK